VKVHFEHDYQQKIMLQRFEENFIVKSAKDVQIWRTAWMQELKSWHSPYKVIIDCSNLSFESNQETNEAAARMVKFFEGLFLRSIVGFGNDEAKQHDKLPFKVLKTFSEAQEAAGVRGLRDPRAPANFRDTIQFQNHFAQHVIEMNFAEEVKIDSKEKINDIKNKLTNNLMQWHSKWSLLIDCTKVEFDPATTDPWKKMESFFRGLFLKEIVGYSPLDQNRENYPFSTYRARHAAVAKLESEGHFMGNDAQCRTKTKN